MDDAKTYADFGIPDPAPCPSWCAGNHGGSDIGPGRAVTFNGASAIGRGVLVADDAVTVGMNWLERFADGAWRPFRSEDVVVFLQVRTDYIPVVATERNMAGLTAIARLISPDVEDRVRQLGRLIEETSAARQAGPRHVR